MNYCRKGGQGKNPTVCRVSQSTADWQKNKKVNTNLIIDLNYNDFAQNTTRCNITFMFLFTILSKVIYKL